MYELTDKVSVDILRQDIQLFLNFHKPAAAFKVDLGNGLIALVGSKEDIRTLLESEDDKPEQC